MKRVTGIGGVFFKAKDDEALKKWYHDHLGIELKQGCGVFQGRELDQPGKITNTIWSPFPHDTTYFEPSRAPFMINYRVENLEAVLAALRAEGVAVEDKVEASDFGRFGWLLDPEGNRIELWEPPAQNGGGGKDSAT
jgi:predicted enzyme related to lactoylglutathione lyase